MATHNPFRGVQDAPAAAGGSYFTPGVGVVEVRECKLVESRRRNGQEMFIAECEVIDWSAAPGAEGIAAGARRSWVVNFQHASALGNVKGFVAEALSIPLDAVDEEICMAIVSPEQPARGVRLKLEATIIKTRAGGDFTLHTWERAETEAQAG